MNAATRQPALGPRQIIRWQGAPLVLDRDPATSRIVGTIAMNGNKETAR